MLLSQYFCKYDITTITIVYIGYLQLQIIQINVASIAILHALVILKRHKPATTINLLSYTTVLY